MAFCMSTVSFWDPRMDGSLLLPDLSKGYLICGDPD